MIRLLGPRLLLEPIAWHPQPGLIAFPESVKANEKQLWKVVGLAMPQKAKLKPNQVALLSELKLGDQILLNYDQSAVTLDNQQVVARIQDVLAVFRNE